VRKHLLSGIALFAVPTAALADDYEPLQTVNTIMMNRIISALAEANPSVIAAYDSSIDYAANSRTFTRIAPSRMVELFTGCTPAEIDTAQRFRDTTILDFTCPNREGADDCSTGDLQVMIFRDRGLALGVIEKPKPGSECAPPAPPPSPRQGSN
jgi:hypothetical protein